MWDAQPTLCGTTSEKVVLSCKRNQAEQSCKQQPFMTSASVPASSFLTCLSTSFDFPQ